MELEKYRFMESHEMMLDYFGVRERFLKNMAIQAIRSNMPWLNTPKDVDRTIHDKFMSITRTTHFYSLVDSAFIWRYTPEGHDFWGKIANTSIGKVREEIKRKNHNK